VSTSISPSPPRSTTVPHLTRSDDHASLPRPRPDVIPWPVERVHVIDTDLGQSGATAGREGFQRLLTEVGLGRAGIVLGLEVSRLARNSTDWHRLLELCALSDTLIVDEDGVYDPAHFNDRLLLGLKGTMSEAELHVLRARLRGGILSKAKRGELRGPIPIGFVYGPHDAVILDPDAQVQHVIRLFFDTYRRTGSMLATVKEFRAHDLTCPRRVKRGPHTGDLVWGEMMHSRARQIIHNPSWSQISSSASTSGTSWSRAEWFPACQARRSLVTSGCLRPGGG
jgi:DNA invertase Pin-like site-specific DNA recombinase